MFLPLGDTPNPKPYIPWVNWGLIGLNVAIYLLVSLPLSFQAIDPGNPALLEYLRAIQPELPHPGAVRQLLAQLSNYDLFVFAHGFKPGAPELFDLFFSMFLHGGFLHLAGNMLFLWIYGDNVEHRLGRFGYLLVYLATGVAATVAFGVFAGGSMIPMVGASGAISGVLGLYFLLFPRNQVKVFVFLFPIFFDMVLLPARWVLGFYLLADNLLPVLLGAGGGVAYGAHIGGFLAGLLVAWAGERFAWQWPWRDRYWQLGQAGGSRLPSPPNDPAEPLEEVRDAIAAGDPERAVEALARIDQREMDQLAPGECVMLAGWLHESNHPIAASRLLKNCLARHPGANLAEVYLALGLMRLRQGQPTAAYQHLQSVFAHDPDPPTAARAREALEQIHLYRRG